MIQTARSGHDIAVQRDLQLFSPRLRILASTGALLVTVTATGCQSPPGKPLEGKSYGADAESFEVVGDDHLTEQNRSVNEAADIQYRLTFFSDEKLKLWQSPQSMPVDGTWKVVSADGGLTLDVDINEGLFGSGEATVSEDLSELVLTMELPVMTPDGTNLLTVPARKKVRMTFHPQ